MASANRRLTVAEILEYLDDNFDIPKYGVDSDIEDSMKMILTKKMICFLKSLPLMMRMMKM